MIRRLVWAGGFVSFLCGAALPAERFQPSTRGKKLIEYGWDCPNTAYVRQHVREMEKRPFDGVIIQVTKTQEPRMGGTEDTLGWKVFGKERFQPPDYEHALTDLKATRFRKFTNNFIQVISMPGIDWFDPEWDAVAHNAQALARVARQGGCVGLMFDPEQYGHQAIWSYTALPEARQKEVPREQYVAKVQERGQQFMQAINREFPDVKILCLFGPSLSLNGKSYDLLAPFLEAMCSVATPGTEIIDGYEHSYGYRTKPAFEEARQTMKVRSRRLFRDRRAFDRVMRAGFGLWLDNGSGSRGGWFPEEPAKNHFQPDTWQSAVHYALACSDRYVWLYSERLNWWASPTIGPAYEAAQRAARKAPGKTVVAEGPRRSEKYVPQAAAQQGYDDQATFGELRETQDVLLDFPATGWLFRTDPQDRGIREKWYRVDLPADGWKPIEIRKFWEEQGWDYDGVAWYRTTFTVPTIPAGRKIELVVGAADESATVWINGEKVGVFDMGEAGWDQRFSLDVTGRIQPGQENQITFRLLDRVGAGGLWKSVKIMAAK
jgi:hypothetical protein